MENFVVMFHDELWRLFEKATQHVVVAETEESTTLDSHNVYSVDSDEKSLCFTKVGEATAYNNDLLITLNPLIAVTGQLIICKKE
ncbi:hypothetical protein ACPTC0_004684 [Escherichia coli]|jgi:hypothetical protein|uniref:hypothetical protein n=1 Tax=Escherichia coli TaxID=562 RepID=UPI000A4778A4|nr:hypothetical protein [Escherichia coli]EFA8811041.1 hypothetical protein [Escherichia coli O8:H49]EGF2690845.1 hypothetical protein [Shigella sonnei]EFA7679397.1 hypothetical protein [Escherichia coli]EFC4551989.1 hypothetical protein [Escherichia coli]EFD4932847.1 hypothetical protein [Escherichia coli]